MTYPTELITDLEEKRDDINQVLETIRRLYGIPAGSDNGKTPTVEPAAAKARRISTKGSPTFLQLPTLETYERTSRPSPVQDAVLKVPNPHTPMTSLEILEKLQKGDVKTTAGSVYATVAALLSKGLITKVKNDEGRVAWTLVIRP